MISRRMVLVAALCAPVAARGEAPRPPARPSVRLAPGVTGYAALDGDSGAIVDAARADVPMTPASTLKAVTALFALDRLGAGRRFRTRIIRSGDMLILAGGGDPHLDTDRLDDLAAATVAAGGPAPLRFGVWGGALPFRPAIAAGNADGLAYDPAVSGMMLNFNRVHLGWQAGGAALSLEARGERLSPRAFTVTAALREGGPALTSMSQQDLPERWAISRQATRRAGSRWLPVRHPEAYAGDIFQTLCRARGLALPKPEVLDDLPNGEEIAGLDSAPLDQILQAMLKHSTNLTAEAVGLHASGAASQEASAAAMTAWLRAQGIAGPLELVDHSGLGDASRITPLALARILALPGVRQRLSALLPSHTIDGGGTVQAKTGTLNFVSNLAGYAHHAGTSRVFAIMCADPDRRQGTEGVEQPPGVSTWTAQAKAAQQAVITSFLQSA